MLLCMNDVQAAQKCAEIDYSTDPNLQAAEAAWNALSREEKLRMLTFMSNRLMDFVVNEGAGYRTLVTDGFGLPNDDYVTTHHTGLHALYHQIYGYDHDKVILSEFCQSQNLNITEDDIVAYLTK